MKSQNRHQQTEQQWPRHAPPPIGLHVIPVEQQERQGREDQDADDIADVPRPPSEENACLINAPGRPQDGRAESGRHQPRHKTAQSEQHQGVALGFQRPPAAGSPAIDQPGAHPRLQGRATGDH